MEEEGVTVDMETLIAYSRWIIFLGVFRMYAIIETGGKQYRVEKDDVIDVELLEAGENGNIEFKEVLFLNDGTSVKVGTPHLPKAVVHGQLVQQEAKGPKVFSFKMKERKAVRRKVGHRQKYTRVRITDIIGG